MTRALHFKARCLLCWKSFLRPQHGDQVKRNYLFINSKTGERRSFSWPPSQLIQKRIESILSQSQELQFQNDESKGRIAIQIAGVLADEGDWTLTSGKGTCPKCGSRFHFVSRQKAIMVDLAELSFTNMDTRDNNSIIEAFKRKKIGA